MAISFVGGTSASNESGAISSISLTGLTGGSNSSPSENDLVIVTVAINNSGGPVPTISGYTTIAQLSVVDTNSCYSTTSYKLMTSTPDTSISFTADGSGGVSVAVSVWRGINTTTPLDVTSTTATNNNSSVPNPPSITPTTTGAVVLAIGHNASARNINAAPSGYSNFVVGSTATNFSASAIASKAWTSGAEDPGTFGINGTTNVVDSWTAVTVAIRPAGQTFTISETTTLTETVTNLRTRQTSVSETTTLTESITAQLGKVFSVSETVSLSETFSATRSLISTISESIGLTEVLIQLRRKWNNVTRSVSSWGNNSKNNSTWNTANKSNSTWSNDSKS